jgi:hypothetical protein
MKRALNRHVVPKFKTGRKETHFKARESWREIGDGEPTQPAPLSLQDVLQVISLPFMQALHTSTH